MTPLQIFTFLIVGVLIVAAVAFGMKYLTKKQKYTGSSWTVYGTDGCGWTRKQLKEMDAKGVSYEYVNCENGGCDGITSFPTLKSSDGAVKIGYTTF